ncbi:hypothetical protein EMIHUDRAFT_445800 [Emiliania huxleyi CCMP1516]|nr:hypothetical protein EMIHUDRAFT_445800 [Emiliania huxleyi CCMP1516]EOD13691.1 hypothetical protein EMIHUDRAFT_445800 [Emiliania huxleyi CCMP1516]|eukprot:XP_005766120.1 hypothetical protein EMIHUDRAFT_445800 [Emiliania huxleyi CCMP1516]
MVEWGDAEPHREATSPSATVRTLLVEGDALQRTAVKAMCAKRGHVVTAVSDAAEALQALDARRFDLVLTSSNDGVGLVRKLRSVEGRRLCCAVMSSDDALEEASSEAGADLFVRKPLRVADIPRLEEAVQRRRRERDALLVERTSGDMEASAVRLQRARRGSLGRAEAARLRAGIQEQIAARSRIPGHLHNALFELGRGTGGGDCLKLAAAGEVQRSSSEEAPRRASGKRWSVFISHYKAEAAMEARWLQGELQERLGGKAFLDSDDLRDLRELQESVRDSEVLVVLQSASVLRRPYVLLELYTAVQAKVPIVGARRPSTLTARASSWRASSRRSTLPTRAQAPSSQRPGSGSPTRRACSRAPCRTSSRSPSTRAPLATCSTPPSPTSSRRAAPRSRSRPPSRPRGESSPAAAPRRATSRRSRRGSRPPRRCSASSCGCASRVARRKRRSAPACREEMRLRTPIPPLAERSDAPSCTHFSPLHFSIPPLVLGLLRASHTDPHAPGRTRLGLTLHTRCFGLFCGAHRTGTGHCASARRGAGGRVGTAVR